MSTLMTDENRADNYHWREERWWLGGGGEARCEDCNARLMIRSSGPRPRVCKRCQNKRYAAKKHAEQQQ